MTGQVHRVNVSNGGVPKTSVASASVTTGGLEGDRQDDLRYHGGATRAVSLFSLEVIERLRAEGHPIEPGSTGENLTLTGLDWTLVAPASRLTFEGGVVLEVLSFCTPCGTIRGSFSNADSRRISQKLHPGDSRVYAKVLVEGVVREGERVCVERS